MPANRWIDAFGIVSHSGGSCLYLKPQPKRSKLRLP